MSYFAKVDLILQERENPNTIVLNRDSRRDKLLSKICELYSIGMEDIRSQNRKGNIRDARNLSFYIMYKVLKYTSTFTGEFLNRNHATVLSGANRTADYIQFDKEYEQLVATILNQ